MAKSGPALSTIAAPTIHITTRQDIELHDIAEQHLEKIQRELIDAGMKIRGACGDCVRNITVCSGCPFDSNSGGTYPAAQLVYEHLADYSCELPRKFKISLSGCSFACAKPWISDLGFIKQQDGLYTVIGAGSLGPKPELVLSCARTSFPKTSCRCALRCWSFLMNSATAKTEAKCVLRDVREKLGDEQFKSQSARRLDLLRDCGTGPMSLSIPQMVI